MWCATKARENTSGISEKTLDNGPVTGAQVSPSYNAAASANIGIWLFFEVWLINMSVPFAPSVRRSSDVQNRLRAYRPQYFLPSIVFGIFVNVTGTYGTLFTTMQQAEALGNIISARGSRILIRLILVSHLLQTFFTGFGISAVVSLFIVPFSSRTMLSMLVTQELYAMKVVLDTQGKYMLSLPTP